MKLLLALLTCLAFVSTLGWQGLEVHPLGFRVGVLDDPGGCTTAVISGRATPSGRPILWKNRDVSFPDQEIVFFNDGAYSYVTITTAGDSSQAWGGVNNVGFAIEDANNWNVDLEAYGPEDDGLIIKLALRTCRTVDDFESLLDSTSHEGHTVPAIFGVIDAEGGAAIFETFANYFIRYDAEDDPLGILVRSNFSYAGLSEDRIGVYRHDRARSFIVAASRDSTLTPCFMCRTVARDLRTTNAFNPYPLPYEGQQGQLPPGWISTWGAICRRLSVSACIIEGVLPSENPLLATMWAFPMAVQYGVALPFWVASGTTPPEVNGDSVSSLCSEGLRIKHMAQHYAGFQDTLDTYVLNDGLGGGVHNTTLPLEAYFFARVDSALMSWRLANEPDSLAMTTLTADCAQLAYQVLHQWPQPGDLTLPPAAINRLTASFAVGPGLLLRWNAVHENTVGMPIEVTGYSVWRFPSYPLNPDSGEFFGQTRDTLFAIPVSLLRRRGFYDVRALY